MRIEKKLIRFEKATSVLCIILCLLSILPSRFELSANAGSANVIVSPSESIQAAINNATTGDTILVLAGIYNESLVVNKSISLISEDRDQTIINGQNNQSIINIAADNVTIEGFTIQNALNLNPTHGIIILNSEGNVISHNRIENSQQGITATSSSNDIISDNIVTTNSRVGITFTQCSNNTVADNIITNTILGINLLSSSSNTISDNLITWNPQGGIALTGSSNNFFSGNVISNNYIGLNMYSSSGNEFSGNTVANNSPGETISYCYSNTFYDNNFYEAFQISNSSSIWNYGGEGNYWSDYAGHDRGDGIGIESYTVAPGNRDNYPLMGAFSSSTVTLAGETYQISVISNSTVSGLEFEVGIETGNKIIQFNVAGLEGTVGFSRIAIPRGLMSTSVIVLVGDREIAPTWLNSQDTAFSYLYFSYSHSNQTVLIISSRTLDLYYQLLGNFLALNATYYALNATYHELLSNYNTQLQEGLSTLNNTYNELLSSYASLLGNYSQLQQSYQDLNTSYSQNLQNVRSLMYIFAAATAILIVIIVYFSKHVYSRPAKAPEEKPILS